MWRTLPAPPQQQPGDDYRLRARRLHDARPAAHPRRPPDSWLIDGVPIPNTNIASNVGPQIDPKDIDYLEVQRGGYAADTGDRTYGVFNVVPRTGFERDREGELDHHLRQLLPDQRPAQLRRPHREAGLVRQHQRQSQRSRPGNARAAGLARPRQGLRRIRARCIYNRDARQQLRAVDQPAPGLLSDSLRSQSQRHREQPSTASIPPCTARCRPETDGLRTSAGCTLSARMRSSRSHRSIHYNRANYTGSAERSAGQHRPGAQLHLRRRPAQPGRFNCARNDFTVGVYAFTRTDSERFGLTSNDGSRACPTPRQPHIGGLAAVIFVEDVIVPSWITLIGGPAPTHFMSVVSESTISPRLGVAVTIPRLHWTVRAILRPLLSGASAITLKRLPC